MSFIIKKKSKTALNAKMVARKKKLSHEVSMAAFAASASDDLLAPMSLEQRPISSLKGLPKRVRKSDAVQVERVARSIKTFKQCAPILINESGEIANGHIVAQALQSLGQTHVWCAVINHLDEDERALLHVTLNRLAETGDWEIEGLGTLLIHLEELDFDLGVTGFTLAEIDILTQSDSAEEVASDAPEDLEPQVDPVSVPGDLWLLGKHRLLCGDATNTELRCG
jgi:ParB-like chromosome segregation protein Spo0J